MAALALLLVVLILITPVLFSTGPPAAGSLLAQAELIVDRVAGDNTTHFYIRGFGATVRYSQMSIETAGNFTWTGSFPSAPLAWALEANGTDLLTLVLASTENPIVLNVSALYQVSGSSARYVGEVAFEFATPAGSSGEMLYASTSTPGLAVASTTSVSNLPLILLLVDVGAGP